MARLTSNRIIVGRLDVNPTDVMGRMPRLEVNNSKENKIARLLKNTNPQRAKKHERHVSASLSKNVLDFILSPLKYNP